MKAKQTPAVPEGRLSFVGLLKLVPGPLGWAIGTAMASAALSIVPFWFIYLSVDALLQTQVDSAAVWRMAAWALLALLLRWLLMAVSHVFAHTGAFAIEYRLRLAMVRRLGDVPLSFLAGRHSGGLRRTLNDDVNAMEGFFAHMLPDAVAAAAVPLATMALLLAVDWRMALAALAPLPLALLAQWWFMRGSAERMQQWSALQQAIARQVGDYVRGIHVVKSFGLDARSFGELAVAVRGAVDWVVGYARQSSGGWVLFVGVLTANLVLVAPLGAWLYLQGSLALSTWVLFLLLSPSVLAPLLRLTFAMGEQVQRAEALQRIDAVVNAPRLQQTAQAQPAGVPLDIECVGLCHRYGERLALQDVSFTARAGQLTALVGPSGSGKSTVARLVARLYEFESGQLQLGQLDVRDWPLDGLLAQLGIVFQEMFLLHGTVRENLALARPQASDEELIAAAKAARAHEFITALPQGYDTPLGERGARLSGGERQRLSIARALLKDAPVLLLDEATASVDAENEALIQQALQTLCRDRTVLMIAHRLRTVMQADHIVVLDAGRVVGQGTHEQLMRECACYQALWQDHEQARSWSLRGDSAAPGPAALEPAAPEPAAPGINADGSRA